VIAFLGLAAFRGTPRAASAQPASPQQAPPQSSTQSQQEAPQQATPPPASQVPLQAVQPRNFPSLVVIDPAHGGADPGARGPSDILESDVVMNFARVMRVSLEGQGLRVLLTRQGNEALSFDDRSKIANAQQGVVFLTLHVSSTGPFGTVRVYSLPAPEPAVSPTHPALIAWNDAQQGFLDSSRKLAELIQIQMAQRFHGSPEVPIAAPVRQLRTIAAPAVAIEVSSVSVQDRATLDQMAPALADAVARAIAAFRTVYESGAK